MDAGWVLDRIQGGPGGCGLAHPFRLSGSPPKMGLWCHINFSFMQSFKPLNRGRSSLYVDLLNNTVIKRVAITIGLQHEVTREEFLFVQIMNRVKVSRANFRFNATVL